jgi:hypothetical protein
MTIETLERRRAGSGERSIERNKARRPVYMAAMRHFDGRVTTLLSDSDVWERHPRVK